MKNKKINTIHPFYNNDGKKPDKRINKIYVYENELPSNKGKVSIGQTKGDVLKRIRDEHTRASSTIDPFTPLHTEHNTIKEDGSFFTDDDVLQHLKKGGIEVSGSGGKGSRSWATCDLKTVLKAINEVRHNKIFEKNRFQSFKMRKEQKEAVELTSQYFNKLKSKANHTPKFMWNCKMRFGKTFTTYQLALKMKWKKVLVLTFHPVVRESWENDLDNHIDFDGWQFISRGGNSYEKINKDKPFVAFFSLQDVLGTNKSGTVKVKNKWIHNEDWDCIVYDEFDYGVLREKTSKLTSSDKDSDEESSENLIEGESSKEKKYLKGFALKGINQYDEKTIPIPTKNILYLSGTPFEAIQLGDFDNNNVYSWTYGDEQKAKYNWKGPRNPYYMPSMTVMIYDVPDAIKNIASQGEFNQFDLDYFFKAEGEDENARFVNETNVQDWLDLLRGKGSLLDKGKNEFPFKNPNIDLSHILMYFKNVNQCYAMKELLERKKNSFYTGPNEYRVIVCAGDKTPGGSDATLPIRKAMEPNPLSTKTITLHCGKLVRGVTIKPWDGIFMLRNLSSPSTYFQSAFRVQSHFVQPDENDPEDVTILKERCFLFDFSIHRSCMLINRMACTLDTSQKSAKDKIDSFTKYLPVLAHEDGKMRQIDAEDIFDYAISGTSGSMLARGFRNPRLFNLNTNVLSKILDDKELLEELQKIEAWKKHGNPEDLMKNVISAEDDVKKLQDELDKDEDDKEAVKNLKKAKDKKQKFKSDLLQRVQNFNQSLSIFMYLTDNREERVEDLILRVEPNLFEIVTGIKIKFFERLRNYGLFNNDLMNDKVLSFRMLEDASLDYTGIAIDRPTGMGLFDTVISDKDFEKIKNDSEKN